jgi:hypothetical protein
MKRKLLFFGIVVVLIVAVILYFRWDQAYAISKLPPVDWTNEDIAGHALVLNYGADPKTFMFGKGGEGCRALIGRENDPRAAGLACSFRIEQGKLKIFYGDQLKWELALLKRQDKQLIVRESSGSIYTYLVDPPSGNQ